MIFLREIAVILRALNENQMTHCEKRLCDSVIPVKNLCMWGYNIFDALNTLENVVLYHGRAKI